MDVLEWCNIARPSVLQWGHGREAMDGFTSVAAMPSWSASFNGAMAVRPWMV